MAKAAPKTTKSSVSQIDETRTPSRSVTLEELMNPMGNTGVYLVNGFLEQDYNPKLSGQVGIDTFDKMRKSDATVKALLEVVGLPIRSTDWFVEPGKDPEGMVGVDEEEIADFVHRALFEKMEQGWDDHIREIMTSMWAGFCVKEKVYFTDDEHVWIQKLAFRKQRTVYRWEQADGSAGITQITPAPSLQIDGSYRNIISIPASKLLIFTHQQEGNNYQGISMLRAAYKHYYIKDTLYKFDSVRHERQSVGVPYIKLPSGCSTDDYNRAKAILRNFRAHEMTGIVMPDPTWEMGFMDLKAGDVSDLWQSIDHHNREILKSGLAQFLELGGGSKGASGSRAVSTDQSSLFLQAIDAVAKHIEDVHNRFLIPELVDLNFDNVYRYPRLQHKRLEKMDLPALATVVQTLVAAGVITIDNALEEWTRKTFDLPPKIEEDTEPTDDEPQDEFPEEEIPEGDLEPLGTGDVNPDDMPPDPNAPPEDPNATADDVEELTPEEVQKEIDDLEPKPNKKAKFYELGGIIFAEIEDRWYSTNGMTFAGPVSDETKAKISAALKAYHAGNGTSAPEAATNAGRVTNITQVAAQRRQQRQAAPTKPAAKAPAQPAQKAAPVNDTVSLRQKQEKSDPNAPQNKKQAMPQKQPASASKSAKGSKTAKSSSKAAAATPKSSVTLSKDQLNPKGNARQKLQGLRTAAQSAKSPEDKQAVHDALVKLQGSLAQKTSNQSTAQNNKAVKAQARVSKKSSKSKGGKSSKSKKPVPVKPLTGNNIKLTEGGRSRKGDDREALRNPIHEDDAKPVAVQPEPQGHSEMHDMMTIYAELYDGNMILAAQRTIPDSEFMEKPSIRRFKFSEEQTSWRPLTFAEQKVNLSALKKALAAASAVLQTKIDDITANQKADLLLQVKRAVEGNDIAAVGKIKAKYTGDLSAALTDVQKQMFEQGMRSATSEMNVAMPPTATEVKGVMRVQSDKLTQKLSSDMQHAATNAVTQVAMKNNGSITNVGTQEAIAAASDSIDLVLAQKAAMHTLSVIGALNLGRSAIFERYPEQVYAFQYSAIIDDATTDLCLSLDGRVVDPGSDDYVNFTPPQHYNCRSVWVEILQDEEFKPEIDGIPSSIDPNATIDTAEDLEAPILKPNSPAIKVLQEELDDRQSKVDQYTTAGMYPNRVDLHTSRIDALKKAISDAQNGGDE